jgi:poly-gamma-glutamate capsule biosynthesis protein CapA/YwtB (metallophosphatase superfamily)
MNASLEPLSAELQQFSSELKRLEKRLQTDPAPDAVVLHEFRQAVDNVRLTAWRVSELINAQYTKKNPDAVLAFLAAERLRRFDQMVRNLCADVERQVISFQTNGMKSLLDSVETLHNRLKTCSSERR